MRGRTAAKHAASQVAGTTSTEELPCENLPAYGELFQARRLRSAVPMSPDGPVRAFKSEYWNSGETDSENGLFEVACYCSGNVRRDGDRP